MALLDRDGVAGAPRFFKAARAAACGPSYGAELTLQGGGCLPVLVESRAGYRNLCRVVTEMKAGVEKGKGVLRVDALQDRSDGLVAMPGLATLGEPPDTGRLARCSRSSARETS
jgi:error-prone DNA polymerase